MERIVIDSFQNKYCMNLIYLQKNDNSQKALFLIYRRLAIVRANGGR